MCQGYEIPRYPDQCIPIYIYKWHACPGSYTSCFEKTIAKKERGRGRMKEGEKKKDKRKGKTNAEKEGKRRNGRNRKENS